MSEHPIFVPFEGDHLAAIVTVPSAPARALVVLLQGAGGPPRTHRYRLWTRTARALADRGIAAVRMDYRGIGDSTGRYAFDMRTPPVGEVEAVAETARRAVGVDRVGLIGNCVGARIAVTLAARSPIYSSVACILPQTIGPILRDQGRTANVRIYRAMSRRVPAIRSVVRGVMRTIDMPVGLRFLPEMERSARVADVLLLHGGTPESRIRLSRSAALLSRRTGSQRRLEVWEMRGDGTGGFRPLEAQQPMIDALVRWMDETLPAHAHAPASSTSA